MRINYLYYLDMASGCVLKVVEKGFSTFTTNLGDRNPKWSSPLRPAIIRDNDSYHSPRYNLIIVDGTYLSRFCTAISVQEARIKDSGLTHQKLAVADARAGYSSTFSIG